MRTRVGLLGSGDARSQIADGGPHAGLGRDVAQHDAHVDRAGHRLPVVRYLVIDLPIERRLDRLDLQVGRLAPDAVADELEPIEVVGKPFDPTIHDAVMQVDSDEHEPGIVTDEAEKGYSLSGKVIRHPKVIVSN